MRLARTGLRQAINDCLEMSFQLKNSDIKFIDETTKELGIVTISDLRRAYSRRYKRVIARGYVKDDTEWYLLKNVLFGIDDKHDVDIEAIERMIENYEEK